MSAVSASKDKAKEDVPGPDVLSDAAVLLNSSWTI